MRPLPVLLAICALVCSWPAAAQERLRDLPRGAATLRLADVLASLDRTHPSVQEAKQLVLAAEGDALSTEGAFDPKMKLGAKGQPAGKYTKGQIQALVTQLTPFWGASFYAGWRYGFGSFAVYDGDLETLSGGELSAGFELPLWRGGPIDDMRAAIRKADINLLAAKDRQDFITLLLKNAGAIAYWNWAEAGRQLDINEQLLSVATRRATGLSRRIEKGDAPEILNIDNQRIIFDRRAKVVAARRKLRQATVKLSLYLRDGDGNPRRVSDKRLPSALPKAARVGGARLRRDIRHGQKERPDLMILARAEARQRVEVELRDNQVAPSINLQGWVAKDLGSGNEDLQPLDLGVGVNIQLPLLLRKERGKLQSAQAKLGAIRQKTRLARDKVEAEVRVAYAAVEAAFETVELARQQRIAAERIAQAERRKFALGQTDLLTVNLRELSAASAATKEVRAKANYQRALADYLTAAGRSPR